MKTMKTLVTTVVPGLEVLDKHHLLQPMQAIFLCPLALEPHLFHHSPKGYHLSDHLHIYLLGQLPPKHNTLIQCPVLVIAVPQSSMVIPPHLNASLMKLTISETPVDCQQ